MEKDLSSCYRISQNDKPALWLCHRGALKGIKKDILEKS